MQVSVNLERVASVGWKRLLASLLISRVLPGPGQNRAWPAPAATTWLAMTSCVSNNGVRGGLDLLVSPLGRKRPYRAVAKRLHLAGRLCGSKCRNSSTTSAAMSFCHHAAGLIDTTLARGSDELLSKGWEARCWACK